MEVARVSTASEKPPSSLATSAASTVIALGSADGQLRIYRRRVDEMPLLQLVWRGKLGTGTVREARWDPA